MLILTRRVGEIIRIGNDIIIKHLGHRGNAARIGILAPDSLSVDREEIYEKKLSKNANSELTELTQKPIQSDFESNISVEKKSSKKPTKKKEK